MEIFSILSQLLGDCVEYSKPVCLHGPYTTLTPQCPACVHAWSIYHARPTVSCIHLVYEKSSIRLASVGLAQARPNYEKPQFNSLRLAQARPNYEKSQFNLLGWGLLTLAPTTSKTLL